MFLLLVGQHARRTVTGRRHRGSGRRPHLLGVLPGRGEQSLRLPGSPGHPIVGRPVRRRTHLTGRLARRFPGRPARRPGRVPQRLARRHRIGVQRLRLALGQRQDPLRPLPQLRVVLHGQRRDGLRQPGGLGEKLLHLARQPRELVERPVPLGDQGCRRPVHLLRTVTTPPHPDDVVRGHRSSTHP